MKIITPDYYQKFKCIADRCRHSCCIGWEIEIDPLSMERYQKIPSIQKHIADGSFVLDEKERCPFLNERGLCRIILEHGEEALCQICADHPRFRNFYSDRIEMGLGLCCEAAADLILSRKEPVILPDYEGSPTAEEQAFFAFRAKIFAHLQDRSRPIDDRLNEIARFDVEEWLPIYRKLERLDPAWDEVLNALPAQREEDELALEQLAVYFVYRHLADALEDGRLRERLLFAVLSVQMIRRLFAANPQASLAEIARMYSAEIEYSEENMEMLLEELYDHSFIGSF